MKVFTYTRSTYFSNNLECIIPQLHKPHMNVINLFTKYELKLFIYTILLASFGQNKKYFIVYKLTNAFNLYLTKLHLLSSLFLHIHLLNYTE